MEEDKIDEMQTPDQEDVDPKNLWQIQKESWYDKIPFNYQQMDLIVKVCWVLIFVVIVLIVLDARDIFHLFGN